MAGRVHVVTGLLAERVPDERYGAVGATVPTKYLQANDLWITTPLRAVLREGRAAGVFAIEDVTDAANAMLGAILLAVLGRSTVGADPTDAAFRRRLTEQAVRGVLAD